ncbi:hypothetical protein SAMN02745121_08922 [Nannocystis exedens]|uniref:Uncharacterized protein n=1 Tax=Nannocystis exedens TaxID=54 RepID=A0A1I2IR69_9BACT|nr:hypothetical protein [Nannocystis exedens]PCC68209.1 hypothetical protein NAEX_01219 [Nannocystis exedens]SFF44815.1 hypothetical protein SAMN02745121_08922 [Nannocystis exedens]
MTVRWPLDIAHSIPTNWRQRLGATFTADGVMHLGIPGVMHERPEIGHYKHALGPDRVLAFVDLIEQQKLWDLPAAPPRGPDQPMALVMQGRESNMRSKVWALDALPPEAVTVLDAFNRLVLEAYASPVRVVTGAARWLASNFSAREPLRLEFTLHSKGTETIAIQNPMAPQPLESLLQLMVARVIPPPGRAPRATTANIMPTSLSRLDLPRGSAVQPGQYLELAPGEEVRFGVTCSMYLSPGEHQAVLLLNTGGGPSSSKNHFSGALALELPRLHIVHR